MQGPTHKQLLVAPGGRSMASGLLPRHPVAAALDQRGQSNKYSQRRPRNEQLAWGKCPWSHTGHCREALGEPACSGLGFCRTTRTPIRLPGVVEGRQVTPNPVLENSATNPLSSQSPDSLQLWAFLPSSATLRQTAVHQ